MHILAYIYFSFFQQGLNEFQLKLNKICIENLYKNIDLNFMHLSV